MSHITYGHFYMKSACLLFCVLSLILPASLLADTPVVQSTLRGKELYSIIRNINQRRVSFMLGDRHRNRHRSTRSQKNIIGKNREREKNRCDKSDPERLHLAHYDRQRDH